MPSFAELKAKAAGVTSSGVGKMQNIRDRNTSVPMKNTNWDPYSGQPPPPPPPPKFLVNKNTKPALAPLPPPPSRTGSTASGSISRHNSLSPSPVPTPPPLPTRQNSSPALQLPLKKTSSPAPQLPARTNSGGPPPPPRSSVAAGYKPDSPAHLVPVHATLGSPPPIKKSTRPDLISRQVSNVEVPVEQEIDWANLTEEDKRVFFSWLDEFFAKGIPPTTVRNPDSSVGASFRLSYPPSTIHGSAALDLAHYFSRKTIWTEAWYETTSGSPIPPPLIGRSDHSFTSSWESRGQNQTSRVAVFFSDLSFFWGSVKFNMANLQNPNNVERSAAYLDRPKALGRKELVVAHETYGETIALFAESYLGSGQCCARGECWDLANEALKYFRDYDYIPRPVPSIGRTHGHLIFEAMATKQGPRVEMTGRWRGGDNMIRRGDIVEWRKVKIGYKRGSVVRGHYTLGDPDHTAIIVKDATPSFAPTDGQSLNPSELGLLVVVEQSLGKPPETTEYDLSLMEEGEMWIYRPIGMQVYLGISDITPTPPDGMMGLQTFE